MFQHRRNPLQLGLPISIFIKTEAAFMCLTVILLCANTAHMYTYIHRTHMYLMHSTHIRLTDAKYTHNNCNSSISGKSASTTPQMKSPVSIQVTLVLYSCSSALHRYSGQDKDCHETRTRRTPDPGLADLKQRPGQRHQLISVSRMNQQKKKLLR